MTRGLAWSLAMPGREGRLNYAVVGGTVYGQSPEDTWQGSDYGEDSKADAAIRTAISIQESEGAYLVGGPVEFEISDRDLSSEYRASRVGWLAERALLFEKAAAAGMGDLRLVFNTDPLL